MKAKGLKFEDDLMLKLRDQEFASAYITSAIIDNDLEFLPIALGDVAKAHGLKLDFEIKPKKPKRKKSSLPEA